MGREFLYKSPDVAIMIKKRAKTRNIVIKDMLSDLGLGSNTLSHMNHGKAIAFDSLARIAVYLDCSVDYLLGLSDNPELGSNIAGSALLSPHAEEILNSIKQLNDQGLDRLAEYADDLVSSGKYEKTAVEEAAM